MAYSSFTSIEAMIEGFYIANDIKQTLADLKAMWERGSIKEYQY